MDYRIKALYPWILGGMIATSQVAFGGAGFSSAPIPEQPAKLYFTPASMM